MANHNSTIVYDGAALGILVRLSIYNVNTGIVTIKADRYGSAESNLVLDLEYTRYLHELRGTDNTVCATAYLLPFFVRLKFPDDAPRIDISNLTLWRWAVETLVREAMRCNSGGDRDDMIYRA